MIKTVLGFILLFFGLDLAFWQHSSIWYSIFLIGGCLIFEGINSRHGFCVLKNIKKFLWVWGIFIIITVGVEIVGNLLLNLWNYPSFDLASYLINVILIGYPLTGFFGLTFFVFIQRIFSIKNYRSIILLISGFLFGYLNEYPNTFAHEWVYVNWPFGYFLGIPILVSILWIILPFIALPFKKFFIET